MASSHTTTLLPTPGPQLQALFPPSPESITSLLGLVLWQVQTALSNATSSTLNALVAMDQIEPSLLSFINSILLLSKSAPRSSSWSSYQFSAIEASLDVLTKPTTKAPPPIIHASLHEQNSHLEKSEPGTGKGREDSGPGPVETLCETITSETEHRQGGFGPAGPGDDPFDDLGKDKDSTNITSVLSCASPGVVVSLHDVKPKLQYPDYFLTACLFTLRA